MMTKDQWASLSQNPGWQALRQYLLEYRLQLLERLAEGQAPYPETMYRAQGINDLANLEWKDIAKFYGIEEQEQVNED